MNTVRRAYLQVCFNNQAFLGVGSAVRDWRDPLAGKQ